MRRIEWTPDKVSRFWKWYEGSGLPYFSEHAGSAIFHRFRVNIVPPVLDYGGGNGVFVQLLRQYGYNADGFEPGGMLSIRQYRTVFLIEVIEHLGDAELDLAMRTIAWSLKPGGTLIITTPNEETMRYVYCANCDTEYHPNQHVRTWTLEDVRALVRRYGFEVIQSGTTNWAKTWRKPLQYIYHTLRRTGNPHIYVAAIKLSTESAT
jgi:SAM-dependent methyltransferase